MASRLDSKILDKIATKQRLKNRKGANDLVCRFASKYGVSSEVAMVVIAKGLKIGTASYENKLDPNFRAQIPSTLERSNKIVSNAPMPIQKRKGPPTKILRNIKKPDFVSYETTDHFINGHFSELNRAFNSDCYTSVFILTRKIIENLIIDLLRKKYPPNNKANKELYYDTAQGRFCDFGIILDNFNKKKGDFGVDKVAVERLYAHAKSFKQNANDKTHSWFHLVETKKEIEDLNITQIFELIKQIEKGI